MRLAVMTETTAMALGRLSEPRRGSALGLSCRCNYGACTGLSRISDCDGGRGSLVTAIVTVNLQGRDGPRYYCDCD